MGHHYKGKNPKQCCVLKASGNNAQEQSRQQCTETNPVQYCLNTPRTTLHRKKPM